MINDELRCCGNCFALRSMKTAYSESLIFCMITEKIVKIGECCDHWRDDWIAREWE